MIVPYLITLNINFKELTYNEIENLERSERIDYIKDQNKKILKKCLNNLDVNIFINNLKINKMNKVQKKIELFQVEIDKIKELNNIITPNDQQNKMCTV